MKFSVACNWDPALLDGLSPYPVQELFGSLDATPVGGGRPSLVLGSISREKAAQYVNAVHQRGWEFNYLLNSPCMGNMEYERETHHRLLEHLEWMCGIGVDAVTVSIPYLLEIVKRQFPQLRAKVSVIAHVNTVARARHFEALGADELMLDYMSNRDFRFLREVRRAVGCDLSLLANDMCLYQCPYRTYHYNLCGHASQQDHPLDGFYVDYCLLSCVVDKLRSPTELIKARWIRPEDLARYEELGYRTFKLSGRRMSTAWLVRSVRAYAERRYDGNLMEIVDGVTPGVDPDVHSPQYEKMLNPRHAPQSERLNALGALFPVKPVVENRLLDGFLPFFEAQDCATACGTCTYCDEVAAKAVHSDERELARYVGALEDLRDDLVTSRLFVDARYPKQPASAEASLEWDPVARREFDQVIAHVPAALRAVASEVIARGSVDLARERSAPAVQREDMVKAFLRYTPEPYRPDMLNGLRSVGITPA